MSFQAVFIVGCGCDGIILSSRAGLSLDGWPLFRAYFQVQDQNLTRIFHKRSAARPENTMPAASQRKKGFLGIFQYACGPFFAVPCIHGIFRPFATTFVNYAG